MHEENPEKIECGRHNDVCKTPHQYSQGFTYRRYAEGPEQRNSF